MREFEKRLESYARANTAEERSKIDTGIWSKYGNEQAIFILDMTGFSINTKEFGIVHYLSTVQRMRMTIKPLVESNGGKVVKFEADNCFARFPDPLSAVQTAIIYNHTLRAMNLTTPKDLDIHSGIGIDYGKFLLIQQVDLWGEPVNFASKLGEDIAKAGQILVTKRAMDMISKDAGIKCKSLTVKSSGLKIKAVEILF